MRGIGGMRGKHQIARIARVSRNREIPGWVNKALCKALKQKLLLIKNTQKFANYSLVHYVIS